MLIVILPYYKNGTNDRTDVGKDGFLSRKMDAKQQKMDFNQNEIKEDMKTSQKQAIAKMDAGLEEMRTWQKETMACQ
jgi:hypothetical protein